MNYTNYGSIIFPLGLAGNHLRWLLFLDRRFPNPFGNQDIKSKLNFIRTEVYGPSRTWNRWLQIEWKFRMPLDNIIKISHDNWDWDKLPDAKELYLSVDDYNKPLLHYYHINLGLNSSTPDVIEKQIAQWVDEFEFIKRQINKFPNKKIIICDSLFEKNLSQYFYQEVIDFYNFDNNYEVAQEVQQLYFESRKKSASEFYEYFTSDNFQSMLNRFYKTIQKNIKEENE